MHPLRRSERNNKGQAPPRYSPVSGSTARPADAPDMEDLNETLVEENTEDEVQFQPQHRAATPPTTTSGMDISGHSPPDGTAALLRQIDIMNQRMLEMQHASEAHISARRDVEMQLEQLRQTTPAAQQQIAMQQAIRMVMSPPTTQRTVEQCVAAVSTVMPPATQTTAAKNAGMQHQLQITADVHNASNAQMTNAARQASTQGTSSQTTDSSASVLQIQPPATCVPQVPQSNNKEQQTSLHIASQRPTTTDADIVAMQTILQRQAIEISTLKLQLEQRSHSYPICELPISSRPSQGSSYCVQPGPSTAVMNEMPMQTPYQPGYIGHRHLNELPIFTGLATEWPLFISCFRNSTIAFNYNAMENVYRLQRCLKGEALTSVECLLTDANNVEQVLTTLETLYGRPEMLVRGQIQRVRTLVSIPEGRLDLLAPFAAKVANLVAVLDTPATRHHMANPMLVEELVRKLPPSELMGWATVAESMLLAPTVRHFSEHLSRVARRASYVMPPTIDFDNSSSQRRSLPSGRRSGKSEICLVTNLKNNSNELSSSCKMCQNKNHCISECPEFRGKAVADRWNEVKRLRLCFSCLQSGHQTSVCRKRMPCSRNNCVRKHHHMLHENAAANNSMRPPTAATTLAINTNAAVTATATNAATATASNTTANTTANSTAPANDIASVNTATAVAHVMNCRHSAAEIKSLYLRILPVELHGPKGSISTFAIFDEGSTTTLIDESVSDALGLQGEKSIMSLRWYNQNNATEMSKRVTLGVSGVMSGSQMYQIDDAQTIRNLNLPDQTLRVPDIKAAYPQLQQLPISEYNDAVPKILIGVDNNHLGMPQQTVECDDRGLIATQTRIGWVIYGRDRQPFVGTVRVQPALVPDVEDLTLDYLHSIVKDYYSTENFGVLVTEKPLQSKEDDRARRLLTETTKRIGNHFETGLLWAKDDIQLPASRAMAYNRLLGVERKMLRNEKYAQLYEENMQALLDKGYARQLTPEEAARTSPRTWYLPHFGVENHNKPNKIRVVFDAAAVVDGTSLNSALLVGPDEFKPLIQILYQFRVGVVGVCGDIQEMFLRINIRPEDREAQRFLWRPKQGGPVETYEMVSMSFGARCSPCSAQYVKNINAIENGTNNLAATDAIVNHHYVDDFVMSFATAADAAAVTKSVIDIHQLGGFNLRNIRSNSAHVLKALGCDQRDGAVDMRLQETPQKILGLYWDTAKDEFAFKLDLHNVSPDVAAFRKPPTRRQVLSVTMSVYDPFGMLCEIMLYAKLLNQEICRVGCGWDDQISTDCYEKWRSWMSELPKIGQCRLPRCFSPHMMTSDDIQLHLFADASEVAFAAAAYWRISRGDGSYDVVLIAGKSRGAPKKMLSIPRLELQAAVLATRLRTNVESCCQIRVNRVCLWTDSMTVLHWIGSDARRYKEFVGHRIAEILETTSVNEWRYVPSADNVADDGTRAKYPPVFDSQSRWLRGPELLKRNECDWPARKLLKTEEKCELKSSCTMLACRTEPPLVDVKRFSTFVKLARATAWLLRFAYNARHKERRSGELTAKEIGEAEMCIFRHTQMEGFTREWDALSQRKPVESNSSIFKLSPYIDDVGVMRMNGRTDAATFLPADARRPILLPREHAATHLIIDEYHRRLKHQNQDAVVNAVRSRFWVPHLRNLVRLRQGQCVFCKVRRARPSAPLMGQLPDDRLTPYVRPFTYTGLDYFGPFSVSVGRRHEKRWVALFTCLTTRAIHLELAADLSTDACLICLRNFMNLRGTPLRIRSDNGTNFIGAKKELCDATNNLINNDDIMRELSCRGVEWIFNSPSHPEAGGCWERMVRCVKRVLAVTMTETAPRVETLRSLLLEAANIVNSRPLTHLPVDPHTEEPLTPNHFLIGCANPAQISTEDAKSLCGQKQWRIAQQMKNCFWRRWISEYLPELTRRTKWHKDVKPVNVGDLVLVCDDNMVRNNWRRGRIEKVFPGPDGRIRNAIVKTANGELRRPVSRLAVLDIIL